MGEEKGKMKISNTRLVPDSIAPWNIFVIQIQRTNICISGLEPVHIEQNPQDKTWKALKKT